MPRHRDQAATARTYNQLADHLFSPETQLREFATVRAIRDAMNSTGATRDPALRDAMAAIDRRTFARQLVRDKPFLAGAIAVGIPADFVAKELGIQVPGLFEGKSKPGSTGVGAGFRGLFEGLQDVGKRAIIRGKDVFSNERPFGVRG